MTSTPPLPEEAMLETAHRIADDVLFPTAQEMDRSDLVPRDRFAPLAEAGLFGIAAPPRPGAPELNAVDTRQVIAAIGGGCGATFFSWVQHHGVVRTIAASANDALREGLLDDMCSGATIAGVAFAHLRRTDRRAITATRVDGGWQLDGFAPWATSWGIADFFAVAAESTEGELVWAVIPGSASAMVRPTPLDLPVFSSTGTVALTFDRCVVPDDRVAAVLDVDEWRVTDRARAALGQPAVLGVADRALRLLGAAARSDDDPVHAARRVLERRLATRWRRDRELVEAVQSTPCDDTIAEASDHRAACLDLAQRATTGLLAAVGGSGMDLSHPAQRLAREASFYVIQAQTADGRAATLRAMN